MTFKVEVNDYGDDELNRLAAAYEAFRHLPSQRQPDAVRWLEVRLRKERVAKMDGSATIERQTKRGFRYRPRKRRLVVAEEVNAQVQPSTQNETVPESVERSG